MMVACSWVHRLLPLSRNPGQTTSENPRQTVEWNQRALFYGLCSPQALTADSCPEPGGAAQHGAENAVRKIGFQAG